MQFSDDSSLTLNVSGYSANATIKKHYLSVNSVSFGTTLTTGLLQLDLTANASLALEAGRYVYDVELIPPSGKPARIVEGPLVITPGV